MGGLRDYFPWHAWVAVGALALVAAGGLLVPPTAGAAVGLSVLEHLLLVGALEFASAVAIAALVLYYQRPEDDREESEWRFDP